MFFLLGKMFFMTPKLQDLYTKKENDRRELRITAELYELFAKTF